MVIREMKVGSFTPTQLESVLYAMAGDDCSLHHDLEQLTSKQQIDHAENQMLTAALQLALIGIGKPGDQVAMVDQFQQADWQALLQHYHAMFEEIGLAPVLPDGIHYVSQQRYYQQVAELDATAGLLNLYMVSGSNGVLHRNEQALSVSRDVNSKLHFARNAPQAGIPVPETHIYTKGQITQGRADAFFAANPGGIMLKILGLAGARNVIAVANRQECEAYIAEFEDSLEVLLQKKLDIDRYTEMTVDLTLTEDSVTINNVRKILFADGKWVGNYFGPDNVLSPAHRKILLTVGDYARQHGHVEAEGTNCGIDYFVDGDEVIVTEINARWTGGLFPAEFLRQLSYEGEAIAFFDTVPIDQREKLVEFQRATMNNGRGGQNFSLVSMGFSPFPLGEPGEELFICWQIVLGDFQAFVRARDKQLSDQCFPTATAIASEMKK
ncbi:MAG: hypothetical protein ABJK20_14140 [Halieaceae bacterium]